MMIETSKANLKSSSHLDGGSVVRLRRVASASNKKSPFKEGSHVYVGLEHITSWTGEIRTDEISKPESQVAHFNRGDILFGKIRPYLAKVSVPDFKGVCSISILVLNPNKNILASFLRYAIANSNFIDRANSLSYGATMPIVSWKKIGMEKIWIPMFSIQHAIADFLDRETGQIDQLIEKKRRLVGLLEEKRNSLITAAVMGKSEDLCEGFNSENYDEMNIRLRRVVSVKNKKGSFKEDIHVYVGLEHITSWTGIINIDKNSKPESQVSYFDKGELLFGKIRPYLAKVSVPDFRGVCSVSILVLNPNKNIDVSFLRYSLANSNYISRVNASAYGVTMPIVNWRKIGMEKIWIPDLHIQRAVADFLDKETSQIDQAIEKIRISIDRLKEYRSALITNAVTGQIDVSKWTRSEAGDSQSDAIQPEMET